MRDIIAFLALILPWVPIVLAMKWLIDGRKHYGYSDKEVKAFSDKELVEVYRVMELRCLYYENVIEEMTRRKLL